ncbi:FecR family protein [Dyadobacter psychrotolerans]|uniref:DUF4974 domain-containing protein n=1 Tax=Dyadobacter psychrotolerans TaxID=2541721 RepID=A0A4R5E2G6_9BACT|nr:FecR domain-containing protein [Dyadobacter psychrotolerans]TDE18303.1 DUF4974 domain-containing protein [Dyadobacter psychrotolerans]
MAQKDSNHDHADDPEDEKKVSENTRLLFGTLKEDILPAAEKELIWNRILEYVHVNDNTVQDKPFGRVIWYQAAAAIALLVLVGLGYSKLKPNREEEMLAAAKQVSFNSADTQLLLDDKRTIDLKGENSDVVYQNEVIRLDSQTIARQITVAQKPGLNTLVVPFGKRSTITLPDGTKIWLNSGSKLVYSSDFQNGKRQVFLEGQAYFSVTHDTENPFYVQTKNMNVKVLGTEFDVSSYDDDSRSYAVLAQGSIELATEKDALFGPKKTTLIPGTRAEYGELSKGVRIARVNVEDYISWKEGYLKFTNTPLNEILKKLSRYYKYDLSVQNAEVGEETFSGTLDLQENIEHVLDVISTTTSLSYHKTERRFILEKGATKE